MPDFPFFNSSKNDFPGLQGLNGQSYRDTFDYSAYEQPAKIRLLNVPWRGDYKDVVRFENESKRDNWLNSNSAEHVEYSTPWLRIPQQSVNIPLPYERASYFNYLFVDVPQMPIEDSNAPTRLCYFISDIRYAAPSTTVLDIELDIWQTYGYRMTLDSLELERGHAPMYRTNVDSFLSNPIASTRYLLAPDVDFERGSKRITNVKHYPIGAGDKWLILALPISPDNLATIGTGSSATATAPIYSDLEQRNGYQLGVTGYSWAHDGYSYQNATLPVDSGATSDGRTLSGSYIYGIAYPDAKQALAALTIQAPHVLSSAQYIALIPNALVNVKSTLTLCGSTWSVISANPNVTIEPFELTKSNIALPDYAQNFAKLYTAPYTHLEVTDNEGRSFTVNIEDIEGNALEFNADISLASATLIFNIEATNIGTDNETAITWQQLDGSTTSTLYGSDIAAHIINWGIPTYSVSLNAGTLEAARKWRDIAAQRQAALNAYTQSVRPANTSLANTQAANATAITNTSNANATNTANTTAANNTATANTAASNTARSNITEAHNTFAGYNTDASNALNTSNAKVANDIQAVSTVQQNNAVAVSAAASIGASLTNAGLSVATGNVAGAMSAGASMAATAFTAYNTISNDSNLSGVTIASNEYNKNRANEAATDIMRNNNAVVSRTTTENNDLATSTTTNNNTLATTTATNNNALATTTAANNASTSNANAGYTRHDSVTTAKENLEQAQRMALAALNAANLDIADVASVSGDNTLDALNRRAFAVKTVTESDYALRAAAQHFTRYGYALNAPIVPVSWLEGGNYCYWQGKNAIIKGNVPDLFRQSLVMILEQGFTVWITPETVGNYDQ